MTSSVLVRKLEAGRVPAYSSVILSGLLAIVTVGRFSAFIYLLTPTEYGVINLLSTLVAVVPLLMGLGLPLQYQRISRGRGVADRSLLIRNCLSVNLFTTIPTLVIVAGICAPILELGMSGLILSALATCTVSVATSVSIGFSQIALGLGYRTLSSAMMFAVNLSSIAPLIPIAVFQAKSPAVVMVWWAAFAAVSAVVCGLVVPKSALHTPGGIASGVSIVEGLGSLPAQVGPWAVMFLVRYFLALQIDAAAVSTFAIAATVVDMAYMVSVSLLGYYSNRLVDGSISVTRSLIPVFPLFVILVVFGTVAVFILVDILGGAGYSVSISVVVVLCISGLSRLHLAASKARAVGLRVLQRTSWIYLCMVAATCAVCWLFPLSSVFSYAVVMAFIFVVLAAGQSMVVRFSRCFA